MHAPACPCTAPMDSSLRKRMVASSWSGRLPLNTPLTSSGSSSSWRATGRKPSTRRQIVRCAACMAVQLKKRVCSHPLSWRPARLCAVLRCILRSRQKRLTLLLKVFVALVLAQLNNVVFALPARLLGINAGLGGPAVRRGLAHGARTVARATEGEVLAPWAVWDWALGFQTGVPAGPSFRWPGHSL